MQITIGAKCWNGARHKTLKTEVTQQLVVEDVRILRRPLDVKLKALLSFSAIPITILTGLSTKTFAAGPDSLPAMAIGAGVKSKIVHAFDPLVDLAISLSYPIAGVMIAGGCLFIMIGNREQGMKMLQNAAIGYILVQLSPMFLEMLVGIGGGI